MLMLGVWLSLSELAKGSQLSILFIDKISLYLCQLYSEWLNCQVMCLMCQYTEQERSYYADPYGRAGVGGVL